jgi:putative ABC transport system substrate-binding protein
MPTVGVLAMTIEERVMAAVRGALASDGFAEGRNFAFVLRSAEGRFERVPQLAVELVARQVSVFFAWGSAAPARAAKVATASIPIVFAYGGDPVADGLVASLNRPGGNVTGATLNSSALIPKRLELARTILPRVGDAALLVNLRTGSLAQGQIGAAEAAGQSLGLRIHVVDAGNEEEIDRAFATVDRRRLGVLIVTTDPLFSFSRRDQIVALAAQYRVPTVYGSRNGPDLGGLVSYGPKTDETWRQAGAYLARILKGEKPGDLPVIQGARFETVVNLKTARALGLDIPMSVLAAADEVIE